MIIYALLLLTGAAFAGYVIMAAIFTIRDNYRKKRDAKVWKEKQLQDFFRNLN